MCTLVILRRPGNEWPVIIASNRDEMIDRPWLSPARHWPERENVLAGKDILAGGTWLGVNDYGLAAGILNRRGSLGPKDGYRSRGELPLDVLDHADASNAADALEDLDPNAYRPFNLVFADNRDAYWIRLANTHWGPHAEIKPIPTGLSLITASDLNDITSARIRTYLPQFEKADVPNPASGDWSAWQALLASKVYEADEGPTGAMAISTNSGFGTVCSSLIALPSQDSIFSSSRSRPKYLFSSGSPAHSPYIPVIS
ncbi:MAG: hypothetical protein HOK89_05650 [Rhodospirillaceae bacterium]|nr:hypothetical protein [Rhodospirillaceae bacterium]